MYYQPVQVRKKGEKLVLKKAMQQSKFLKCKSSNNTVAFFIGEDIGKILQKSIHSG